jgi:hypothetical protein
VERPASALLSASFRDSFSDFSIALVGKRPGASWLFASPVKSASSTLRSALRDFRGATSPSTNSTTDVTTTMATTKMVILDLLPDLP